MPCVYGRCACESLGDAHVNAPRLLPNLSRPAADEPRRLAEPKRASRFLTERNLEIAAEVVAVAAEVGRSPSQVALRWLLQRRDTCIPIVGGRNSAQIQDNLKSTEFALAPEHVRRLDEASAIELGFPHNLLNSPGFREFAFAGTLARIENLDDPLAAFVRS